MNDQSKLNTSQELLDQIQYDEKGLIPAIAQDVKTLEILMVAYMNAESLRRTLESGYATFWSRSRRKLWMKGETSGNLLKVRKILIDCDCDTLILLVEPAGPACHTGQQSCFYRRLPLQGEEGAPGDDVGAPPAAGGALAHLQAVVHERRDHPRAGSYTSRLLDAGLPRLAQKVGEEAVETLVAALGEGDERLVAEAADLVYHLLVLLAARDLTWEDVEAELARRFR